MAPKMHFTTDILICVHDLRLSLNQLCCVEEFSVVFQIFVDLFWLILFSKLVILNKVPLL